MLSLDEGILTVLADGTVRGSAELAEELATSDRTIRRRLRRLVRDGYAFSPFRGGYRITATGVAAMAPLAKPPGLLDRTPADLLDRVRRHQ